MLDNLPNYIPLAFLLTTIITLIIFYLAANKSKVVLTVSFIILILQGLLSYQGFYLNTTATPPRFVFIILPTLFIIIFTFFTNRGKDWLQTLDLKMLTLLSIVRVPVELILYGLFIHGAIPELMTFAGRNFDIIAGITAPVIYYLIFIKKWNRSFFVAWNVIGLILIINIVANAILSAPLPFQQFAFDQPNIGVLNFPFTLLACFVAPVVLYSHLIMLFRKGK